MNWRLYEERNSIEQELQQISRDLEETSSELSSMQGTGIDHCSTKLLDISQKYRKIGARLQSRF